MTIRAVIVDFGGVLVRTVNRSGRDKWEKRLNLPANGLSRAVFDSDVALQATIGQVEEDEIWKQVAFQFHLDDQELQELISDFWAGDWLDRQLVDYLVSLRPRYKTAILSNAWSGARLLFQNKFSLHNAVDEIIISSEEGLAKPDPNIYQRAAEKLGVHPNEAIFVDDMPENVVAARQAGLFGVQFRSTSQVLTELNFLLSQ